MRQIIDDSHRGLFATVILSVFGSVSIDVVSQVTFILATAVTGTLTSVYTIKKIKKLNNEKDTE